MLIAVVSSLCLFHIYNMQKVYDQSQQYLNKMKNQFNSKQYDSAEFTANEFENYWNNCEHILDYFVTQDHLEDIRITITEMPRLAKHKSKEFLSHIEILDSMLRHVKNKENTRLY